MSALGIVACGLLGILVAGAVWVVAANQANRRPLFSGPACAACGAALSPAAWLPGFGFGGARRCRACGADQFDRQLTLSRGRPADPPPAEAVASETTLDGLGAPVPEAPPERSPAAFRRPWWRPIFEVAVAGYFAAAAARLGWSLDLATALVCAVPLLVIFLVDAWTRYIYTNVILVGVAAGLILAAFRGLGMDGLLGAIVAGIAGTVVFAGFFFLAILIYRNINVVPFGLGDVYLAGAIGTMVRWPDVFPALVYGILLAAVILGVLLVLGRVGRRQPVPYGPFLCLGALVVLLVLA